MLFHAEVDQFVVLDDAVVVVVIPEYIFDEVVDFTLVLVEDLNQKLFDLCLLKTVVTIGIKFDHLYVHHFSHLESPIVRCEFETLMLGYFQVFSLRRLS